MVINTFRSLLDEVKKTSGYWAEAIKFDFAHAVSRRMEQRGLTKSALATATNLSPQYITKALRGDQNFTIEQMVKLVHALDGRLQFQIEDVQVRRIDCIGFSTGLSAGQTVRNAKILLKVQEPFSPHKEFAANDDQPYPSLVA